MITQARLKELLTYDPLTGFFTWNARPLSDFSSVKEYKRHASRYLGKKAGCYDGRYVVFKLDGSFYMGHRLAWLYAFGEFVEQVDHRNRRGGDNWITNLREATHEQNQWNQGIQSNNTSGFKGVSKAGNRWRAAITAKNRTKQLGSFATAEEASEFYQLAADMLHGEFALHE